MRNQTVIRTLIREMINEIDRFKKEKGRDYDVLKDRDLDLEKMAKEEISPGVPRYYFNMANDFIFTSKGEKGGSRLKGGAKTTPMASANPKAEYNTTPMGYYGYPLTVDFIQEFKEQRLPYMQGSDWLTIVEATSANGLLYLSEIIGRHLYVDRRKYAEQHLINNGQRNKLANAFATALLDPNKMIKSIKNKRELSEEEEEHPFTWVYDPGTSTIHRSEPTQVVFLTPSAFKVVDRFPAKAVFESLTGGEERYKDQISSDKIDPRIAYTLKNTTDPNAIAKLTQHPHPAVRTKAAFHPLAPKEYFSKEIDSIFTKLREILSNKEYSKFEGVAGDLGGSLRSSPGQDRTDVYDSLLELIDEMTPDAKGNVYVHYGLDAILEGIIPGTSVSKNESLAIRMIEDLSSNRIIIPGLETSGIVDAAISRIAKASLNNEKVLDKYFERITGKKNVQYTFEVFFKIVMEGPSKISKLKALKAFAATKSLPSLNNIGSRLYMTFAEIAADIFTKPSPKEYDALIDTAKVILDSDKVSETMFSTANKILLKDKENKSGSQNA